MIAQWMTKLFGASWKTSLFGLIGFLAGMVVAIPLFAQRWPLLAEIAKYVMGTSFGAGLLFSKDKSVTGGDTPNTTNNALVVSQTAKQ